MVSKKSLCIAIAALILCVGALPSYALNSRAGSCKNFNFPYNSQGDVDWPYGVKVLKQDAVVYPDANVSSVTSTVEFNKSLQVKDVQGTRVQVAQIRTGVVLGWIERENLLCALSPLKGKKSGLEQKFYIRTATEERGDKPSSVQAYPASTLDGCNGLCRELSRFEGYFVFDVDEQNNSYLLSDTYKLDPATLLVGWVSGEHGFLWDTAYGVRPREDLVFPPEHAKAGEPKSVCAYRNLNDAAHDPMGKCMPILGGEEWFLYDQRIPILDPERKKDQEFYKVVLPLPATGAELGEKEGEIKIIRPDQFTQNPGIKSILNMKRIDVLFLIDGTKSLKDYIEEIRGKLSEDKKGIVHYIIEALQQDEAFQEARFRFGFRIYRDTFAKEKGLELEEGFPFSSDCEVTYEEEEQNIKQFYDELDKVKVTSEKKDDYPENLFGGIKRAVRDLYTCPQRTKLLFVVGDCGYDANTQRSRGVTPIDQSSLTRSLKGGGEGTKDIVTFFIQIPKEKGSARRFEEYKQAYDLFTVQAREILTKFLGLERVNEIDNYFLPSNISNLYERILQGIKQFANTQVINELVLDLRGGTALKAAIGRLKGSEKYNNIPGLFWDLVEQGSCVELGKQCQERIYDTVVDGYIPVSEELTEDIWLTADDVDTFTSLLRAFDPDRLATLSGTELRRTFVETMKESLENVIRKPLYEDTGESIREYLKRKGGLPVSDTSPLFGYSIDDLEDPDAVPDCEIIRLVGWVTNAKRMLNILYQGTLRPAYKLEKFGGECPTGDEIPYISEDIQAVPLGKNPEMRYNHSFQKANVYWVPKEYLP